VHRRRLAALLSALLCAGAAAALPGIGCNGTGTTPLCDFPDGANDPDAGCGELIEAAAPDASEDADTSTSEDSGAMQGEGGQNEAGPDTAAPPVVDSGQDSSSASDAGDAGKEADANHDAHG
jgi:hypothetical protein